MPEQSFPDHLSQMSTSWTVLFQAHDERAPARAVRQARQQLLERYEGVIMRYLRGLLRNLPNRQEAAEDCYQEFALRFISGRFKGADPNRGRFRDYLKMALRNLAREQQRRLQKAAALTPALEPVEQEAAAENDQQFVELWRDDLLARTLKALAEQDRQRGQNFFTVLRLRMDHPKMRSPELAAKLSQTLGKPVTDMAARKQLFRARERFAQLMIAEVKQSLQDTSDDAVRQELAELGLYEYCRTLLEKTAEET